VHFFFDFFVWNFKGFALPRSWPRDFHGQASTSMDLGLKQAWIDVKTRVGDLATVVGTYRELLVPEVKVQASDIFPTDLLFAPEPGTRSNTIHLDGQNRWVGKQKQSKKSKKQIGYPPLSRLVQSNPRPDEQCGKYNPTK